MMGGKRGKQVETNVDIAGRGVRMIKTLLLKRVFSYYQPRLFSPLSFRLHLYFCSTFSSS